MNSEIYPYIIAFVCLIPFYVYDKKISAQIKAKGLSFYDVAIVFLLLSFVTLLILLSVSEHLLWQTTVQSIFFFLLMLGFFFLKKGTKKIIRDATKHLRTESEDGDNLNGE